MGVDGYCVIIYTPDYLVLQQYFEEPFMHSVRGCAGTINVIGLSPRHNIWRMQPLSFGNCLFDFSTLDLAGFASTAYVSFVKKGSTHITELFWEVYPLSPDFHERISTTNTIIGIPFELHLRASIASIG